VTNFCRLLVSDESFHLDLADSVDCRFTKYDSVEIGVQQHAGLFAVACDSQKLGIRLLQIDILIELHCAPICEPVVDRYWW